MHVPKWFEQELNRDFHGRLRVRWSRQDNQWHVEQKVGRSKLPRKKIDAHDDQAIRWTDGYEFVLGVTPGDRASCPRCKREVRVPVREMRYAKCGSCDKEFRACFYPLGHDLLEHLRWSDPYRGGTERLYAHMQHGEFLQQIAKKRSVHNEIEDITKDEFNRMFDIQSVGYTGKVFTGHNDA